MALNYDRGAMSILRHGWLISLFVVAFIVGGCGGSEEATQEQKPEEGQKLGEQPQQQAQEQPKEEKPYDQALTSFIGADKKAEEKPAEKPAVQPTPLGQYEKQIEDLRTENTSLKQKMVKLEQDNRTLTARLTDTETKLAVEKDRADRAEEAAKGVVAAAPTGPTRGEMKPDEASTQPMSLSSYEDALKAFNSKKYDDAMKGFQGMLDGGVSDDLADNCKYWLGESNYAKRRYKDAMASFESVFKYKNSEKKADAQFMIAQCYERLGNKVKAKEAYEKVVKDYPMSRNVKKSKERWAKL